jgi:hypothetical protein
MADIHEKAYERRRVFATGKALTIEQGYFWQLVGMKGKTPAGKQFLP